ncbi:hypothetical protein GCM10017576_23360 [Microbacterium barkeri]|uniref:Uncharacterized protein n=1 Tax=Microbacterium barkeri TaxID=33917 RepID=A0A9W6H413_9MICO|nr:hypothetical protein [Microbacterium barkeri]MDI6944193.1 hypothetical protein [Microbacterium barkeri]MDR6876765.1 hypothetical protein [Microbacterium barkeri]GLJ62206.1 hypothetical protein GCM10017576_23360 [Microbacterium barkeri]
MTEPAIGQEITRAHAEAALGLEIDAERWVSAVETLEQEGSLHGELSSIIFDYLREAL